MESKNSEQHIISYQLLFLVWICLLVLTLITVFISNFNFGYINVIIALSIATAKVVLVIYFFMHLKYEEKFFKVMLLLTVLALSIMIGFTFFDTLYR